MGVSSIHHTHTPRTIRKLIQGREYTYDQRLDMLTAAEITLGSDYDRTQVDQPIDLCFEITTFCNCTCPNCFSQSSRGASGLHVDMGVVRNTIGRAMPEILRVCITGGEPLVHPGIGSLLDLPSTYPDCGFVLSTNASVRSAALREVQEHPWLVAVSVHGPAPVHDAYMGAKVYRHVEANVAELSKSNVVHIYCVLHDGLHEPDLDWLFQFRDQVGATFLRFIIPRASGRYRVLQKGLLVDAVRERLDGRSGLKVQRSLTRFISARLERRMAS